MGKVIEVLIKTVGGIFAAVFGLGMLFFYVFIFAVIGLAIYAVIYTTVLILTGGI